MQKLPEQREDVFQVNVTICTNEYSTMDVT